MTSPDLNLIVQYASAALNLPNRARIRRWVSAALEQPAQITVRIVDAEEAQSLNRAYRHKDYATNVLTFAYGPIDTPEGKVLSGDIVICASVVEQEAAAQGKTLHDHFAHLTLHGTLHLQGYDHENAAEAALMETREAAILKRFNIANPYLVHDVTHGV